MKTVAEKLRYICFVMGLTPTGKVLCGLLGVGPSTLCRWHQGVTRPRGQHWQSLHLLYNIVWGARGSAQHKKRAEAILQDIIQRRVPVTLDTIAFAAGLGWLMEYRYPPKEVGA